jgi:malonyl-CoA decarboxylase
MRHAWFSRVLDSVADRGRDLLSLTTGKERHGTVRTLCEALLSGTGEASGMAIARDLVGQYDTLDEAGRVAFFTMVERVRPDPERLHEAAAAYVATSSAENLERLQHASESPRQELFRRINLAPAGTAALVRMRGQLRRLLDRHPGLRPVDRDLRHLLASWFNPGFLELERIDWHTPAAVLEKLIQYESVHAIRGWDDLHRRLKDDRRCFAFVHPALPDEPVIFVEVALTKGIPGSVQPLLDPASPVLPTGEADSAVFYSINSTQPGLAGISFGNFLIKQVVAELASEFDSLETFVTLSPLPRLADALRKAAADPGSVDERRYAAVLAGHRSELAGTPAANGRLSGLVAALDDGAVKSRERLAPPLRSLAIAYLTLAKTPGRGLADPVARFHLANGASLESIRPFADLSESGRAQAFGVMANYRYDPNEVEVNHERFVSHGEIAMSRAVARDHKRIAAAWNEAGRAADSAPPQQRRPLHPTGHGENKQE